MIHSRAIIRVRQARWLYDFAYYTFCRSRGLRVIVRTVRRDSFNQTEFVAPFAGEQRSTRFLPVSGLSPGFTYCSRLFVLEFNDELPFGVDGIGSSAVNFWALTMAIQACSGGTACNRRAKSGIRRQAPFFMADSWAKIPAQVMFAACTAFGNGSRSSISAVTNS